MKNNVPKWIIYKHTAPNGKCYIGQTKQNPTARWQNGRGYERNIHFFNAIKKYDWRNFEHQIIESDIRTQDKANEREMFWIEHFDSFVNGYNLTKGGENRDHLGTPVLQIDVITLEIVNSFLTLRNAEVATGIDHTQIGRCCTSDKRGVTAGGYYWCFQDEWFDGWKPKSRKKPKHPKKAVYQIDEDLHIVAKFESGLSAEAETGIPSSRINLACHKKGYITAGGFYWCFVEEWSENWRPMIPKGKKSVVRINKNDFADIEIYPTISAAAKDNGIINSELIGRACAGTIISAGNFYWCYLEDYDENWTPRIDLNKRKIICIETNIIYESISEAIKLTGGSTNVARACKDPGLTSGGFHWAYLDEWEEQKWKPRDRKPGTKRAVRCIETGEIFESATSAGKSKCLSNSAISKCCKNHSHTVNELHWCFEDEYHPNWEITPKKVGRHGMKKVLCVETNITYDCINTAFKETGIDSSSIIRCCKGTQETAGNFHWQYIDT